MNTPFSQTVQATEPQLKSEEMDQILGAIVSGKYSWACALILRFTGHEPLHYLPQRTYTRIMRENWYSPNHSHKNCPPAPVNPYPTWPANQAPQNQSQHNPSHRLLRDLDYHDRADAQAESVQGGSCFAPWFYRRSLQAYTVPDWQNQIAIGFVTNFG
jgi:hypothetical protein